MKISSFFTLLAILVCIVSPFGETFFSVEETEADDIFEGNQHNLYEISEKFWKDADQAVSVTEQQRKQGSVYINQMLRNDQRQLQFKFGSVLDAGTGIGQVADFTLTPLFENVDVFERSTHMFDLALSRLGNRVRKYYSTSMQDFQFEKSYDLIWISSVLLYISDSDIVDFLKKAKEHLNENGVIFISEPASINDQIYINKINGGAFRPMKLFYRLFEKVGLQIVKLNEGQPIQSKNFKHVSFYLR